MEGTQSAGSEGASSKYDPSDMLKQLQLELWASCAEQLGKAVAWSDLAIWKAFCRATAGEPQWVQRHGCALAHSLRWSQASSGMQNAAATCRIMKLELMQRCLVQPDSGTL